VSNPIVPDRARGRDGVGLRNISERLAVHFGERARLDAGPADATTWQATITLPALREHGGAPESEPADTR
jgi:sensor histidine kinase YesM